MVITKAPIFPKLQTQLWTTRAEAASSSQQRAAKVLHEAPYVEPKMSGLHKDAGPETCGSGKLADDKAGSVGRARQLWV